MSSRRSPGEIVRRKAGSGFVGSTDPQLVKVPEQPAFVAEADPCMMGCGDPECREWANLEIMVGPHKGSFMYHIPECQMDDPHC